MFTGLIERTGRISELETSSDGARLQIAASGWTSPLKEGESIAVNGICLSVVRSEGEMVWFDLLNETVQRTSLKSATAGDLVNLERAMQYGDRFGGHVVSGHVDGCGVIEAIQPDGRDIVIRVACDTELMTYIVPKGSIALNGISLTVGEVRPEGFDVYIIPVTREVTALSSAAEGDPVNLELDMLAKYAQKRIEKAGIGMTLAEFFEE